MTMSPELSSEHQGNGVENHDGFAEIIEEKKQEGFTDFRTDYYVGSATDKASEKLKLKEGEVILQENTRSNAPDGESNIYDVLIGTDKTIMDIREKGGDGIWEQ